jgi:hypothetical protein
LAVLLSACVFTGFAAEVKQTPEPGAAFVGAIGCRSSSCHGGAGPKRSQYITWSRYDFHTKAFAVLINARSARIAETLGSTPAQANARCTVCHSPLQSVAQTRLAATAHPDEGVSCESCHGAAGPWLRGHTRRDWNYATRVSAGMRDLRSLYVRANTCVACHQNVEPALLNAGHPELTFELDSQSANEPPHWADTDPWSGPRAWLTGQAVALREISWALSRGEANESERARGNALAWLLAKTTAVDSGLPKIPEPPPFATASDFGAILRSADDLARRAAQWNVTEGVVLRLMRAFASSDADFANGDAASQPVLARRAERLVLALERLQLTLDKNRGAPLPITAQMKLLAEDVRPLNNFDAARFAGHLGNVRNALPQ